VDLRCCRQCRFYDTTLANQCREPQAERVSDKTAANFCDYFAVGDPVAAAAPAASATSPRDALERLFRR
jgi:hypothetical protein